MAKKSKDSAGKRSDPVAIGSEGQEGSAGAVYGASAESSSGTEGDSLGGVSEVKPKITIPLTDAGRIDLDSMRASTRSKLESAIKGTPGLMAQPGSVLSEKDCEYAYSLLGQAEMFIATKFLGVPEELAQNLRYTSQDIKDLTEPTREVAAKYGMGVMSPEVKLGLVLIAINTRKIIEIRIEMARHMKRAALAVAPRPEVTQ